jgi:hypothetical protein
MVTMHLLEVIWWKSALGVVPFLAAGLLLHAYPWLILGVALLLLFYVTVRLRACLARFHEIALKPGEAEFNRPLIFWGPNAEPKLYIDEALGPTHALLHNDKLEPIVPIHHVLLLAAATGFGGWLLGQARLEVDPSATSHPSVGFLIVVIALIRWVAYIAWPPVSLWGRLRTQRWIIPRFDRALLVPVAIIAAGFIMMRALTGLAVPLPWSAAATLSLAMLIALGAGPTRGAHRLTAAQHYRVFNLFVGNILSSAPSCEPTPRGKRRFSAS